MNIRRAINDFRNGNYESLLALTSQYPTTEGQRLLREAIDRENATDDELYKYVHAIMQEMHDDNMNPNTIGRGCNA